MKDMTKRNQAMCVTYSQGTTYEDIGWQVKPYAVTRERVRQIITQTMLNLDPSGRALAAMKEHANWARKQTQLDKLAEQAAKAAAGHRWSEPHDPTIRWVLPGNPAEWLASLSAKVPDPPPPPDYIDENGDGWRIVRRDEEGA